jgi:predicted nucleotidyltransferase
LRRICLFRFVERMTSVTADQPTAFSPEATFPEVSPAEAVALAERRLRAHTARWRPAARVILFGARARGQARRRSDFNLAVGVSAATAEDTRARSRAAVADDGQIIYKVDIVGVRSVSTALASRFIVEGIVWQN